MKIYHNHKEVTGQVKFPYKGYYISISNIMTFRRRISELIIMDGNHDFIGMGTPGNAREFRNAMRRIDRWEKNGLPGHLKPERDNMYGNQQ